MKKRKMATAEQWAALYEAAGSIRRLEPWKYLSIENLVAIELERGQESVICSVMCTADGCGSISVYEGQRGYEDIQMLLEIGNQGEAYAQFALAHQSCLALHFVEREAVLPDQKDRMKQLGLRYRGRGNWPVFLSLHSRFAPCGLDQREVLLMTKALQGLVMSVRSIVEMGLAVNWDAGESLFRMYDEERGLWLNLPYKLPPADRHYPGVQITDELMKRRLKKFKKNRDEILVDLVYINQAVDDENWERPVNPLIFLAVDKATGIILNMQTLEPDQPEADAMMQFMLEYMHQNGCMRSVTARNRWLLAPLVDLSKICGFRVFEGNETNMAAMDEALDEFFDMMDADDEEMDAMIEELFEFMVDNGGDDDEFDGPF